MNKRNILIAIAFMASNVIADGPPQGPMPQDQSQQMPMGAGGPPPMAGPMPQDQSQQMPMAGPAGAPPMQGAPQGGPTPPGAPGAMDDNAPLTLGMAKEFLKQLQTLIEEFIKKSEGGAGSAEAPPAEGEFPPEAEQGAPPEGAPPEAAAGPAPDAGAPMQPPA